MDIKREYKDLCLELSVRIKNLKQSREITSGIKSFFSNKYSKKMVLHSNGKGELLWDICILENEQNLKDSINSGFKQQLFCIVESEIGGESASSPNLMQKNLRYDFHKLLLGKSKLKFFIGAYSIGKNQNLNEKISDLHKIYLSYDEVSPLCLFMIMGTHNNENRSNQILVETSLVRAFIMEGNEVNELNLNE